VTANAASQSIELSFPRETSWLTLLASWPGVQAICPFATHSPWLNANYQGIDLFIVVNRPGFFFWGLTRFVLAALARAGNALAESWKPATFVQAFLVSSERWMQQVAFLTTILLGYWSQLPCAGL